MHRIERECRVVMSLSSSADTSSSTSNTQRKREWHYRQSQFCSCNAPNSYILQRTAASDLKPSKPATSLADPYPKPTVVPRFSQKDNCCDYESELAVVIGRTCKNVSEEKALEYVLGYTACNDVSHRDTQLETSQWCFSKGFDGACPTGPCLVSPSLIPDPSKLRVRGIKNKDKVLQDGTTELVVDIVFRRVDLELTRCAATSSSLSRESLATCPDQRRYYQALSSLLAHRQV